VCPDGLMKTIASDNKSSSAQVGCDNALWHCSSLSVTTDLKHASLIKLQANIA